AVATAVQAGEAVVVAVVPGGVGVEQAGEAGQVALGEGAEHLLDDGGAGIGGGLSGHNGLSCVVNRGLRSVVENRMHRLAAAPSIVQSISTSPCCMANIARAARVDTPHFS